VRKEEGMKSTASAVRHDISETCCALTRPAYERERRVHVRKKEENRKDVREEDTRHLDHSERARLPAITRIR